MLVALSIIVCIYLDEARKACSSKIWILYRGKAHMNRTLTVCQTVLSLLSPQIIWEGKERQLFIYLSFLTVYLNMFNILDAH